MALRRCTSASLAGSGGRSRADGLWPICEDCSARWSVRTAGQLAEQVGDATPDGMQRLRYNSGGTRTWFVMTSGTTLWSIWAVPTG